MALIRALTASSGGGASDVDVVEDVCSANTKLTIPTKQKAVAVVIKFGTTSGTYDQMALSADFSGTGTGYYYSNGTLYNSLQVEFNNNSIVFFHNDNFASVKMYYKAYIVY